ncbi:hypothetical protein EZ428_17600 [Pedobacter frigiditerrae]|uniref:Uncharacterized protein n=1 Tax=Pedobacter frigiditerrae TaxID=2530452 RepID=A0A4V2MI91_9SPHI|nr:hypothetical protein [Pedobacter frigiditerrae]TCC89506.1 hypothetical protein EZ428_17600 [Pedobacter frigiditerrae]
MKKLGIPFLVILLAFSCNLKDKDKANAKPYFDLAGYFKKEAIRLSKTNPILNKTVFINGKEEQKNINIKNWDQEFKSFIDADINKASWNGSFNATIAGGLTTYTSHSEKIPVKKLEISLENNRLTSIKVYITNANDLYTSQDSLSYYPDSLYQIKKTQHIKLMETKQYRITGKFK